MKTEPSRMSRRCRPNSKLVTPFFVLLILIAVIAIPFFSNSSASSSNENAARKSAAETALDDIAGTPSLKIPALRSFLLPQLTGETLTVFQGTAGDCSTPGPAVATFDLGQTICATITGAPFDSRVRRRLAIVNPAGLIVAVADVTTDPQTLAFEIPTDASSTFEGFSVDNRGTWRVNNISTENAGVKTTTKLTVQDPAQQVANLTVNKTVDGLDIVADGATVTFNVLVTNEGPNTAVNVVLSDDVPANATFVFGGHPTGYTGPTFNCSNPPVGSSTGSSSCTIASLAKGAFANFQFQYTLNTGLAGGTVVLNTATITSDTFESHALDNSSTAGVKVAGAAAGATCTVDCPANIVVTADTTQGGNPGKFVTYGGAAVFGDCGEVTNSPASGSFFTVGTHTVTSSTSAGPSCTFTVKVVDTPAPTISCPADKVATAGMDGTFTFTAAEIGTPTFTASGGGTVTFERSDNVPAITDEDGNVITPAVIKTLTDPFPTGITGITWTVTDADGRTASCTQRVIVQAVPRDVLTISCPANATGSASGGCGSSVNVNIGTPTTNPSDSNVTVEAVRSDGLSLSDPYPVGVTTVTWTATDAVNGNVASCTQTVTVSGNDTTAPTLTAPPPVTATTSSCSALLDDELGVANATDDCGGSVSISRTGVPANFLFPTGTTTITYIATDASGNTATATQTVTVLESPAIPPTVSAPNDVTAFTGAGATSCGTFVSDATLGTATASDNCPGVVVTRTGVPAGNIFPVGNTTVTYTATDRSGNTATDTQVVTVVDNTPPVVTAPAAATLFTGPGATSCSVTVSNLDATLGTGTATDNCPGVGAVSRTGVPSGNVFPVGTTTLTYSATDAHGNTASATQVVTVIDNTKPVFTQPTLPDITL